MMTGDLPVYCYKKRIWKRRAVLHRLAVPVKIHHRDIRDWRQILQVKTTVTFGVVGVVVSYRHV